MLRAYNRARYKSDEGGLLDDRRKHIWIVGADGSAPRRLTDGDWDDAQPGFSPDGREIAFVSNRTDKRDLNTVFDIHVVTLAGETRRITDGEGSYGNPSWSPDGATITAYGTDQRSDRRLGTSTSGHSPRRGDRAGTCSRGGTAPSARR